jgi:predicted alpha/beta-hydrolase family hydrolase
MFSAFEDSSADPVVRGFVHQPAAPTGDAVALTHGAGGNCQAKLLVAVAEALAASGFVVLRFDLPFRVARPFGPPHPGTAERDREGIRRAVALCRNAALLRPNSAPSAQPGAPPLVSKGGSSPRVFLAGHSYGGRQASMLLAEDPEVADGLLLLSYPLHPPNKPQQLRTQHFPQLNKPTFFIHGTWDPFATTVELQNALKQIPARHGLFEVENAGHDLLLKKSVGDLPAHIAREFVSLITAAR